MYRPAADYPATGLPGFQGKRPQRRLVAAPGLLSAFLQRMRRFVAIAIAFQCARLASAGTMSPLTAKEIALMLRAGYSSETILNDLAARHFAGPLDSNAEAEMRQLNASPKLLDELKGGQLDATTDELTQAQEKIAAANAAEEQLAREKWIALQNGDLGKSTSSQGIGAQSGVGAAQRGQERAQAAPKIVELKVGQSLDLREFDGPNIRVVFTALEMDGVIITLQDYDHMLVVGGWGVSGCEGYFPVSYLATATWTIL